VIVAGLLVRAVQRALSADPGFEYARVIVVDPALADHGYTPDRARAYVQDLSARLRGVAGMAEVSVTSTPPLSGLKIMAPFERDGRAFVVFIHQVDTHYLATMKIPLVRGRNLIEGDERGVVVSESLVQRNWPNGDALGQPLRIGDETLTVIGVSGSARTLAPGDPDTAELYRIARADDFTRLSLIARTGGPPDGLLSAVAAAANGVDSNVKPHVQLLRERVEQNARDMESTALAVSLLGAVALAVACLGVVGLMAYAGRAAHEGNWDPSGAWRRVLATSFRASRVSLWASLSAAWL
jgi:hypothetical protein